MGYTGRYTCPGGDDFNVNVTEDQYVRSNDPNAPKQLVRGTASAGRATLVAHGLSAHGLDWSTVSNETFVAPPVVVDVS